MATMTELPETTNPPSSHDYHAEANVFSGRLKRPIDQVIELQASVELADRRGGNLVRNTQNVSIEGLISFTKGETRVSGARSLKNNAWVTLATSIVEGLNVFEIIGADRVVAQVSTDHAEKNGHVPNVTFLGTQFTNFRVGGFPVTFDLDLGVCGDIPHNNKSYLQDRAFLGRVKEQTKGISKASGLPKEIKEQYDVKLDYIEKLLSNCDASDSEVHEPITCSLVQSIGEIPIPGVQIFGHVIVIPKFGSVALGEVEVGERLYEPNERPSPYFTLTGIKGRMGCVADGVFATTTVIANGHHRP
jgi:hypothetical protein